MSKTLRLLTLTATGLALVAPHPPAALTTPADPTMPTYQEIAITGPSVAAETTPFAMVGVTWPAGVQNVQAKVRIKHGDQWTGWQALHVEDGHGPDTPEGNPGTEPLWVGDATGIQASAVDAAGTTIRGAKVTLIQPGVLPADSAESPDAQDIEPAASRTPYPMPNVWSRKRWGADEKLRNVNKGCSRPKYTRTVLAAFVHHTADRNDYTRAQVPAMLRATYAYHVKSRGWCDLGYNFLVDRFGRAFEGRYGGAQLPVLGAHTESFNSNSFGVSLIGNFDKAAPPASMLEATARVIAWKLDANYRSPTASIVLARHRVNTISGHRDTKATACPGQQLYAKLPWLKQRVQTLMGGTVSTPIYRFAKTIGFRSLGQPFWGEHRTRTGWATYFGTRDIFYSVSTGAHSTAGVFRQRYRRMGPDTGLGLPTTEVHNGRVGGTRVQSFRDGGFYWTKPYGVRPVTGLIYRKYVAIGAERSRLGLPMTDIYQVKGGLRQKYQHGWLTYHAHRRTVLVQYRSGS
ncbi:N-acetylmuramoyl-L-alanine amidase [Kribbella sp. NPDC056951]|uniref:N-acetylmuramoyl-L-alanine amidase n=1 Tax=Kribbella sp. NPDC056951 TaxID=3345978 RepID=UPI00363F6E79